MIEPKDVIKKIKEEEIKPRPKWEISFKNYAYWGSMGLMILFGSAVFSIVLAGFFDLRFGMQSSFPIGKYIWLLGATMPLAWIILGIVALIFGIMAFRKTRHGYRYRNLFVVAISVLVISILALLAHSANISRRIEGTFERTVPRGFHRMMPPKERRFFQPDNGLIAGKIFQVGNEYFILLNHRQDKWKVIMLENTQFIDIPNLETGLMVFVSGKKIDDNIFQASIIRLFEPPKMGRQERGVTPVK